MDTSDNLESGVTESKGSLGDVMMMSQGIQQTQDIITAVSDLNIDRTPIQELK